MDNLKQFLIDLHARGIHLLLENGKLISRAAAGAITAELGQQIRANKEAIIALLQENAAAPSSPTPQIPRRAAGTSWPLSFAQQRMWFLDQLEGASQQYNMPVAMRLHGQLLLPALQAALDQIVARHEILRTVYTSQAGEGLQTLLPLVPLSIQLHDLPATADAVAQIKAWVKQESARAFQLDREYMLRASLLRVAADDHVLCVTLHHIATDGWSMGILVREFVQLYRAQHAYFSQPAPDASAAPINILPVLPIQYADYAVWQRQGLDGAALAQELRFWQHKLDGLPQVHSLPLDFPRPAQQQFSGVQYQQQLPMALHDALQALAGSQQATLFMLLQAAFALFIARWSGETDIVMGSPIAGRTQHELDDLIGLFVNTLVLRNEVDLAAPFTTLLAHSKQYLLDAYAHQSVPFEKLVDVLKPERSLAYTPLFQIMFTLQSALGEDVKLSMPGLEIAGLDNGEVVAKFDLELTLSQNKQGLGVLWNAASSLFTAASLERMSQSFCHLLQEIVAAPQSAVGRLPLLPAHALLAEAAQDTPATFETGCIHLFIEQQAQLAPQAAALHFLAQSWNYQQLNQRANQIAHVLMARGVQQGSLVGVCMERSPDMVAAMLGILKAGAAYVPLDPAYPANRIEFMVQNAALQWVVTQADLCVELPQLAALALCTDTFDFSSYPTHNPTTSSTPNDLAYVIYTSGTTGQPKGVQVEHQGVLRLARGGAFIPFDQHTVFLQATSISFDAHTFDLWGTLINGGALVLYPERLVNPELVNLLMHKHAVTATCLTSGLFDQWSYRLPQAEQVPHLRWIMTGGDIVSPVATQRIYQALPMTYVVNLYGPTENSCVTTMYIVPHDHPADQALPLGYAVAGTTLHVLDEFGVPLPRGVAGELCVRGAGVARGYWQRPELNQKVFAAVDGARQYRTGDKVRWRQDGRLEFLGRFDAQVKIRGFRIELEEIENQLQKTGHVAEACVVVKGEGKEKQLIAFVVCQQAEMLALSEPELAQLLKQEIRRHLPEYMLPSAIMRRPALPLTPNGKLDRKKLAQEPVQYYAKVDKQAPRNAFEETVATVWGKLLQVDQVGIDDTFFEMGGNSITLIELKYRLAEHGYRFDLKDLMENATIRDLSAFASKDKTADDEKLKVVVQLNQYHAAEAGDAAQPLYIVHPFGGGVGGFREVALALQQVCPVYGIQAPYLFNLDFEFTQLHELAQLYADAIMLHHPGPAYALGGYSGGGKVASQIAEILLKRGFIVNYCALFDTNFVDPDFDPNEDDFARLCRFCYSLHIIQSADEIPIAWRELPYEAQLEQFSALILKDRNYEKSEVITSLKFGVNLLRAKVVEPQGLSLAGVVDCFICYDNPANADNLRYWNTVYHSPVLAHQVDFGHNQMMEKDGVAQMLPALIAGLKMRRLQADAIATPNVAKNEIEKMSMSATSPLYLRQDVYIDPLVNQWYAWPNLLAPIQYAMYMTKTHRRLMNSFVNNYELHIIANQDPSMAGGGEFVNCSEEQVADVKQLIEKFDTEHAICKQLADSIKALDTLLRSHTSGETIEPLYAQVPPLLQGYVELFMDLYHQPSYRLIEGLLYKSPYYDTSIQSVSFGILSEDAPRPFVLSTPRLAADNNLQMQVPFADPIWDTLFQARTKPLSPQQAEAIFSDKKLRGGLPWQSLFTTEAPPQVHQPVEQGVRLSYVGHAGFLIETSACSVLVDPVIANRYSGNSEQVISFSELPERIDYLCLTHNHSDHVNIESLLQIRHKVAHVLVPKNNGGSLADPSLKLILRNLGFSVSEVDDMDEIALPSGRIICIPFLGEHGDLNIRSKTAWMFELLGKKIYAGADSSNMEPKMYQHIHDQFGDLDVLAIGMECVGAPYTWLYGALTTDTVPRNIKESRRLNGSDFDKAAGMVAIFKPKQMLIYALGMEAWYGYFMGVDYNDDSQQIIQSGKMLQHCQALGIEVERMCGKRVIHL